MKTENIIQQKTYAFSIRIINLYKYLSKEHNEYVLSKQLLKCGTSIGANVEESIGRQSKKDFHAKINISYKEARETHYWLRLLKDTNYLSETEANSLIVDCEEILKIIGTIIKTLKTQMNS